MIIVDSALAKRAADGAPPIRVGMIGAGFMAAGVVLQINTAFRGQMQVTAIANRTPAKAVQAYADAGQEGAVICDTAASLAAAIEAGKPAVTEDPMLVATSPHVDVFLEVTGAVEDALPLVLAAIEHGKHIVLMNAELDGTVGPLLKAKADKAGVVYTNVDGDQPGVEQNLYRFVKGIGVRPVLCGNIKGLQDPYRTPTTQAGFAKQWGQKPSMVTSFADGTKISFEQAIVANAIVITNPLVRGAMTAIGWVDPSLRIPYLPSFAAGVQWAREEMAKHGLPVPDRLREGAVVVDIQRATTVKA